jgi:hypothetical protein
MQNKFLTRFYDDFSQACEFHIPTGVVHDILKSLTPALMNHTNIIHVDFEDISYKLQFGYSYGIFPDWVKMSPYSEENEGIGMVDYLTTIKITNLNTREDDMEMFPIRVLI